MPSAGLRTSTTTRTRPGRVASRGANATKNTLRATLKWGWAVAATTPLPTGGDDFKPPKPPGWNDNQGVGAFEGGHGNFATGVSARSSTAG